MSRIAKLRKLYNPNRSSPFQVSWNIDGKRFSRFFRTEKERDQFATEMTPYFGEGTSEILKLDLPTVGDVISINRKRGDTTFKEIWDFWERHHKVRAVLTLFQACDKYVRDMWQKNERSKAYILHTRKILERLCDSYGDRLLETITRIELDDWIASLPFGAVTKKNHRSTIRAAWTYFERSEWIDKNVAVGLQPQKIVEREIEFLTVGETEKLLRANEIEDPEVCGLIALGLFAGMRSSAIARVEYSEIDFKAKGILTPAEKTKKGRRNYIENLPDNLWAWLEQTPKSAFGWSERKWKKRKEIAFRRAGLLLNSQDIQRLKIKGIDAKIILPPKNALRHSFATYHVAWKRNFQDTALIMSHRGTAILFNHYKGNTSKEEAEKYFNIYPADHMNKLS